MSAATVAVIATVAGTAYAAHEASKGASEARAASDKALAYEKERDVYARGTEANRYGTMQSQTAPYRHTGTAANTEMARLLGQPDAPPSARSWMTNAQPPTQTGPATGQAVGPAMGGMVAMRAPDGTIQNVPADHVDHYKQRGATPVG